MKKFYKAATAETIDEGFTIALDGRAIKTPAKTAFVVPTLALAEAAAAEWDAQEDEIDQTVMLMTNLSYAAIDRIRVGRPMVVRETAAYAGSDLLCYRADHPPELAAEQSTAWQPLLDWARDALEIDLVATTGIVSVTQSNEAMEAATNRVATYDNFALAALDRLTHITGSLVLALAVMQGRMQAHDAYDISHLEELWQAKMWGADEEAEARHETRKAEMVAAQQFVAALG
jgi:chaperone required for assembly of F1-ATPase